MNQKEKGEIAITIFFDQLLISVGIQDFDA